MAIGRQLNAVLVNDCLMQTGQAIGHTMVMLDQATDALKGLSQAQMEQLGFVTADATDVINLIASWGRLLDFIKGTQATPVAENFRPGIKKVVGINF
jgi:hypothetical protein